MEGYAAARGSGGIFLFSANTLPELAAAIKNPYQAKPMNGAILQTTVERYNSFVESGRTAISASPRPNTRFRRHRFMLPGRRR